MRLLTFYFPWMIAVGVVCSAQAYFSHLNNQHGGKYAIFLYMCGLFPIWTMVSRYSKNLVFDGIFYDIIVTISFALALIFFSGQTFKPINWLGLAIIIFGLILIKR